MSFKILPCTDYDMPRVIVIMSEAFAHDHAYLDAIFPAHDTLQGRQRVGERLLYTKIVVGEPKVHFLKVVQTNSGQMIGMAEWEVYDGIVPEVENIDGDFWPSLDGKEYAQHMYCWYQSKTAEVARRNEGRLVCELYYLVECT